MPTITVPAAALANAAGGTFSADIILEPDAAGASATAGLTRVGHEVGPLRAAATASGPTPVVGGKTVTVPAAALANAAGGTFTADIILEPDAAATAATAPTPSLSTGFIEDYLCGEYGAGYYGAGFYGICSVISMSLFATTWDISYTTDDASDSTPTWINVTAADIRSVDVSRGREDELGRVEAGTAQLVLNNRTRSFDPQVVSGLRPMNRWRIRAVHNAVTYDVFLGYAESYEQSWPGVGYDAITTVRLVDEFKVLALAKLPTMDPPTAQSYEDVVKFDEPQGYWRFQEPGYGLDTVFAPTVGSVSMTYDTNVGRTPSPIVGDSSVEYVLGSPYGARNTTNRFYTIPGPEYSTLPELPVGGPGDAGGMSEFTVEFWFKSSEATPASTRVVARGPLSSATDTWGFNHNTDGTIGAFAKNSGGTTYSVTSAVLSANTWYHLVLVIEGGGFTTLYVNGVVDDFTSFTGSIGAMDAGGYMQLGPSSAVGGIRYFDEVAFYRYDLPAARVLAHYQAGTARGFQAQDPGPRITSVLAASTSIAASYIRAGSRGMIPAFMTGQSPLDELRKAEDADNVDSMLFIAKDGTITFLDDLHRSALPWSTVQATFDDDGTDLPYRDITVDYSETFLYNTIRAARVGGESVTSTNATSVSRYHERLLQITDLPLTYDPDVSDIATALLAKYKDPMTRITSIGIFLYDSVTIASVLDLELADRVRILRTHPGGGARIDQTAFVQKIQLSSRPGQPITVTLGVSPL